MKLTSISIIFIIIISPFLFISAQQSEIAREDVKLRNYYDSVVDNAVQDAALMLANNGGDVSYRNVADISYSRILSVQAFFDSLYHSFKAAGNSSAISRVNSCVPVLIYFARDSYSLYALNSYKGAGGQTEIKHCWYPEQHYVGDNLAGRYSVRYTLDDKVFLYNVDDGNYYEGSYYNFSDVIPAFGDRKTFDDLRLTAVKLSVENDIMAYLDDYNKWSFGRSGSIVFNFPRINNSDWKRALTDEGLLVFAQGFPVLTGGRYEHYALGGARVIRKAPLVGYSYKGILYYCRTDCTFYLDTVKKDDLYKENTDVSFSDSTEAAKKGYYPCRHCRP